MVVVACDHMVVVACDPCQVAGQGQGNVIPNSHASVVWGKDPGLLKLPQCDMHTTQQL